MSQGITAATALKLLAKAQMRPFGKHEWDAYSGCESKEPMFGSLNDEPGLGDVEVILDGSSLLIVTEVNMTTGGEMFNLKAV